MVLINFLDHVSSFFVSLHFYDAKSGPTFASSKYLMILLQLKANGLCVNFPGLLCIWVFLPNRLGKIPQFNQITHDPKSRKKHSVNTTSVDKVGSEYLSNRRKNKY